MNEELVDCVSIFLEFGTSQIIVANILSIKLQIVN